MSYSPVLNIIKGVLARYIANMVKCITYIFYIIIVYIHINTAKALSQANSAAWWIVMPSGL